MRSLLFATVLLIGCPQPEEDATAGQMGAQPPGGMPPGDPNAPPGPPGDPNAPPGDPNAQPGPPGDPNAQPPADPNAAASAPPPSETAPPTAPTPPVPPGLASLIADGKTVTIKGTVKGAKKAQVDFTQVKEQDGQKLPDVIEVIQITDGTFTVTAPATYDKDIWITAVVDSKGDGPTEDDWSGVAPAPVRLAGKDVIVEIPVGASNEWLKKMPWYQADIAKLGPKPPPKEGELPVGATPPPAPAGGTMVTAPEGAASPAPAPQ